MVNLINSYRSFEALAADYDLYQDFERTDKDVVSAFARLVTEEAGYGRLFLDLGAGTGNYSLCFVEHDQKVIAGDVSGQMLRILEVKRPHHLLNQLWPCQMSAYSLPFRDNSLDVVVATLLFQHLAQPEQAVAEIKRVLKSTGMLATWFHQDCSWHTVENPVHQAIAQAFRDEMKAAGLEQTVVGWSGKRGDEALTRLFESRCIVDSDELVVTCRNSAGWLLRKIEHRSGGLFDMDVKRWAKIKERVRNSLLARFGSAFEGQEEIQQGRYRIAIYRQ